MLIFFLACASDYEIRGTKPDIDPGMITECDFSPVAGTKLSSYDCNPVFDGGESGVNSVSFYTTEVLGHPFYQIWYTDINGAMNYAASSDGTNWNTHPQNPLFELAQGQWDQDSIAGQVVVWDPVEDEYVMAYQGFTLGTGEFDPNTWEVDNGIWGLGISTSSDGVAWTKHPNNPVINFSALDPFTALIQPCWPLTITLQRQVFQGYIAASSNDIFSGAGDTCSIYSMNAFNAGSWTINEQQPVLVGDQPYDSKGIASAAVVEYNDVMYMFYVGFNAWIEYTGYRSAQNMTLNLATSVDGGNTWTKDPNNPIPINQTAELEISNVGAQVIGSRIHLWITDKYEDSEAVGYYLFEPDIDPHEAE